MDNGNFKWILAVKTKLPDCEQYIAHNFDKFNIKDLNFKNELCRQICKLYGENNYSRFRLKSRIKTLCKRASVVQTEVNRLFTEKRSKNYINEPDVSQIKQKFGRVWDIGNGKLFCVSFLKELSKLRKAVENVIGKAAQTDKEQVAQDQFISNGLEQESCNFADFWANAGGEK